MVIPAIPRFLNYRRPRDRGQPSVVGHLRDSDVFCAIGSLFVVARSDIGCRLLAARCGALFFVRPRPAAVAAGVQHATEKVGFLAIAARPPIRQLGRRWLVFLFFGRILVDVRKLLLDQLLWEVKELRDEVFEKVQDAPPLHCIVLATHSGEDAHEAEEVEEDILIFEAIEELVSWGLALGGSGAPLLLVSRLDNIDKMFRREGTLIVRLDLDTHVIETLQVHVLSLALPDLLPLTLQQKR